MPSVVGRLTAAVVCLAGALIVGGTLAGFGVVDVGSLGDGPTPAPAWLAGAVGVVAVAQLARLRVRVGAGAVQLAWGEAAIIVLCSALPPVWIPLAVFTGVLLAQLILAAFTTWRGWAQVGANASSLTIAGTAAAVVAWAVGPTYQVDELSASFLLALCAAAATYAVVGAMLVVTRIALQTGAGIMRSFAQAMNSKLLMLFGNLAVGLLVVLFCHYDRRFLLLLPPVVWLLHQTYAYKLRGDDERRTWQAFAEATGALNRLDERDAVTAGINGALRLFRAADVEVVIASPDGRSRRYTGRSENYPGGEAQTIDEEAAEGWAEPRLDVPADPDRRQRRKRAAARPTTVRKLTVGQVHVGELRLRLPGSAEMAPRDRLMFAAYGDALAAAVHDAVTHDELVALSERKTYDAVHDPLTGLNNRAALMTRGNLLLRRQPPGAPAALLLLDLDRFKEVNNTLGHPVGDELLRVLASRLEAATLSGELLARLGGDEFALLAPVPSRLHRPVPPGADIDTLEINGEHAASIEYAVGRARQLAELLATPIEVSGVLLSVEASVGVVVAPAGEVDLPELLRRADIAMYQAKRGGPSIAWYQPTRDEASTDKLALLAELREALSGREQLRLLVQPAIGLATGDAIGVEALVRWHHPRRGLLNPERFLSAVEHSELIGPFTRYVLDRALEIAARWRTGGIDVPIAVNLSPRALLDARLPDDVRTLLALHGVPAQRLILEITESVVVSELAIIDEVLAGLRALGVQLAVDDFGTGYSSLTFLTRVQVDEIKIDRAFVGRMVDSPEAAAIVRTTVDLARRLDLRVVAEGVETAEQRNALMALGCTAAQGYHFFSPMTADKAATVLRELRTPNVRHLRKDGTG